EVDGQTLSSERVRKFLEVCGLSAPAVAALLEQASAIVDADGAALLRIERPQSDDARASAHIGLSTPARAGAGDASDVTAHTRPLALPSSR
ncbi:MAG TPA: hypothetical protein VGF47_07345, partial [Solirubrobacteraceae bacterium]